MKFKEDSFEIIFFARGGEGGKSAAEILAQCAAKEGKYVKAFPFFGPERSGAPTKVYLRISAKPIRTQEPIVDPDIVVVLDETLLAKKHGEIAKNLDRDETLIINSKRDVEEIRREIPEFKGHIKNINATEIALQTTGKPIPNVVILGQLVKISSVVDLKNLKQAFSDVFAEKLGADLNNKNLEAIQKGYDEV